MLRSRIIIGYNGKTSNDTNAGDIVFWSSTKNTFLIVNPSQVNTYNYPPSTHIPIGVVVIPSSHDVYGTGESGVMSLTHILSSWGGVDSDSGRATQITKLKSYGNVAVAINTALTNNNIIGYSSSVILFDNIRIDKNTSTYSTPNSSYYYFTKKPSPGYGLDTNGGYCLDLTSTNASIAPSPYLEDGSRNPSYHNKTTYSGNSLSDFNGKENTEIWLSYATGQPNWKTDSYIKLGNDVGDSDYVYDARNFFPGPCLTWKYSTVGTSQGDWYVPAMGELGYLFARYTEISHALDVIFNIYPNTSCSVPIFNINNNLDYPYSLYSSTLAYNYSNSLSVCGLDGFGYNSTYNNRRYRDLINIDCKIKNYGEYSDDSDIAIRPFMRL